MKDLDQLRQLVESKRLERGGGMLAETQTDAAKAIGCSQPSLRAFLKELNGIDVEMSLRLARYLELQRATVLRLAGHEDIADMLDTPDVKQADPDLVEITRALRPLDTDQRRAIVSTVKTLSKTLVTTPRHLPVKRKGKREIT